MSFDVTYKVLENLSTEGNYCQRGDVDFALNSLMSFDFIFILDLMMDIMEITEVLSQVLQQKSQDILNAMDLVSSTKKMIAKMREVRWEDLLKKEKLFCEEHKIDIPDLSAQYVGRCGRSRRQQDDIDVEHYYRVDVFIATNDFVLQELNNRFNILKKLLIFSKFAVTLVIFFFP